MASAQLGGVLDYLRQVTAPADGDGPSDRALLAGFVERHDEAAFAALVQRHGPMVFGVCRRVLGDAHDAEDAFQATFLVLARRAASVRKQESVGSWLYGVAYRTAQKARIGAARRRARERQARAMTQAGPEAAAAWQELRPLLDAELSRLPEKYRAPLVLCYLEGKTNAEAARQLGWTKGTVSGRLARARELLRGRLGRRGLALAPVLLVSALGECTASAALPAPLAISTVKAAIAGATGAVAAGVVSARTAALAEGVLHTMLLSKLKAVVITLAAVAMLGAGGGLVTYRTLADGPGGSEGPAGAALKGSRTKTDTRTGLPILRREKQEAAAAQGQPGEAERARLKAENEALRRQLEKARRELERVRKELQLQRAEEAAARSEAEAQRPRADEARQAAEREARHGNDAVTKVREAAARVISQNNLKQMGLAMYNYLDSSKHFPPPAVYTEDGKPLLSWRVTILPYLEQDALYRQFKLDEAWDSPHNKKLLAQMPPVYRSPVAGKAKKDHTFYQVFSGKGTMFPGPKGVRIADVKDGTSNTILIVEAGAAVPWTKPADLPYKKGQPLPKLGGIFGGSFNMALADGSVRFVRPNFDPQVLRALITRNGGEAVDFDKLNR